MPLFANVIAGKKVALFAQIDRRLYALMDLQIASAVPWSFSKVVVRHGLTVVGLCQSSDCQK